jgi:hypothetical protein
MTQGRVHTLRRRGVWLTEIEDQGPVYRHESESEALEAGEEAARRLRTSHVIHRADGLVVKIVDYGDG